MILVVAFKMMARPHSSPSSPAPGNQKFPRKLHQMLDNAERNRIDHIASWLPCGRAFAIHNQEEFFNTVMPIYFPGMKSYKSFRRQLNLYGIYRLQGGGMGREAEVGKFAPSNILRLQIGARHSGCIYSHPFMVRGDIKLCHNLTRKQLSAKDTDLVSDRDTLSIESEVAPIHQQQIVEAPPVADKSPPLPLTTNGTTHNTLGTLFSPKNQDCYTGVLSANEPLKQATNILQVSSDQVLDSTIGTLGALRTDVDNTQPALQKRPFVSESKEDQVIFIADDDDIRIPNYVDVAQQFIEYSSRGGSQLEVEKVHDASPTETNEANANPVLPALLPTPMWKNVGSDTLVHSRVARMTNPSSPVTTPTTLEQPFQALSRSEKRKVYPTGGNETLRVALFLFDSRLGQGPVLSREEQEDIDNEIILTFVR